MLDAPAVRRWCRDALDALGRAREEIDALNVFPVPDGDTGTNLLLTVEAAPSTRAGARRPDDGDARPVPCAALAHGALLGARGNSGVILSQMLRGAVEVPRSTPPAAGRPTPRAGRALRRTRRRRRATPRWPSRSRAPSSPWRRAAADAARARPSGDAARDVVRAAAARGPRGAGAHPRAARGRCGAPASSTPAGAAWSCSSTRWPEAVDRRAPASAPRPRCAPPVPAPGAPRPRTSPRTGRAYEVMYLLERRTTVAIARAAQDARPASATRSSSSAATGCGTSTCTSTTSGPRSRPASRPGRPYRIRVTHFGEQVARQRAARAARRPRRRRAASPGAGPGRAARRAGASWSRRPPAAGRRTARDCSAAIAAGARRRGRRAAQRPRHRARWPRRPRSRPATSGLRVAVLPTRAPVQALAALAVHDPGAALRRRRRRDDRGRAARPGTARSPSRSARR